MLKSNTLRKVFNYYYHEPQFAQEISRALTEFFGVLKIPPEIHEQEEKSFNEWLLFDYRLKNGQSLLENFYHQNPLKLTPEELEIYQTLQNNYYGLYEVLEVKWGRSLQLKNLQTDQETLVKECLGTFGLSKDDIIICRIAQVDNDCEIVGGNFWKLPFKLDLSLKNYFTNTQDRLNPKIIRELLIKRKEEDYDLDKKRFKNHPLNLWQKLKIN